MWKYLLKDFIIYLLYNAVLLIIAYFFNRFYQMLIFILTYELIQNSFKYRFHADSIQKNPVKAVRLCKIITICVEVTYLIICINLDISIYLNLLIIVLIATFNCLLEFSIRYYLDKYSVLKDKDVLIKLCNEHNISEQACNRLIMKYVENKTYQEIADIEFVDIDSIKKSINRSKHKIFKD